MNRTKVVDAPSRDLPFHLNSCKLIGAPLQNPGLWMGLAWVDVVQSYRRTMLGPFWITLNLVIFTVSMTLIYGALFSVPTREYAAYLACGMIGWFWISALLTEVGNSFLSYGSFIKGSTVPKSIFIWAVAFKQVIVFLHHLIAYIGLVVLGVVDLSVYTLFAPIAVLGLFVISIPITALASILFARYRDLPRLITSSIIVLLMITPIFWQPGMIGGWRTLFIHLNPIYYLIEFVRLPLLGKPEEPLIVSVMVGMTIVFWVLGETLYRRYEKYVVFWI